MIPQELTKSSELGLAGVFQAKLECLQGRALIHDLEACVVTKDVENSTIGLPQELQPGCDDSSVGSVPGLLARNCGEHN